MAGGAMKSKICSGIFTKVLSVSFVGILAWAYQAIQPPPFKIYGSPGGPSATGPRIMLRDGRHLAYKEHGVSKDMANYKIIHLLGFSSWSQDSFLEFKLSPELAEQLRVYIVNFNRPGYGESDPHPSRTLKSMALDIEELADQLGLGSKFYLIGSSMGGLFTWSCLKYIPHRIAGASLVAPAINFWWPGFPSNLSTETYRKLLPQDQWAYRVIHYTPWLSYWWNTQKWFPGSSLMDALNPDNLSRQDKEIVANFIVSSSNSMDFANQQGGFESIYRDLRIAFGKWGFDPMDLKNPFLDNEGFVHLWQGDEDRLVTVKLQRYVAKRLPWVHYHELKGSGHMFAFLDGMFDKIIRIMVTGE